MAYKDKEAQRAYQARWLVERRAAWLAENGPCSNCGSTDDLCVDHVDHTQKVSHNVWSWSQARRDAELAKCQVLCLVCHKVKNGQERNPPHGTHSRYANVNLRCRCSLCTDAHAAHMREWRAS